MEAEPPSRCPRTDDEVAALLNTRPDGWEHQLYAGMLHVERTKLEDHYRDHLLGFARIEGPPLGLQEAFDEAQSAFDDALAIIAILMNMFDAARYERAFGLPGEPGDPELIQHLARRTVDGYAELMEWARRLRSMRVPSEMQEVFRLAAAMMDRPVEEFREYVDLAVTQLDRMAELIAKAGSDPDVTEDNPLVVTIELTLSIDDEATQRFNKEFRRAKRELLP